VAEAFLHDPQNQITENESTTFKDIIDYWVEHRAMYTKKYRPTSSREYRNRIQQATWWSERIGEYDIHEVTMDQLERSFIELSSIRAAKTAAKYKWTLGLIYASAIKRGLYNGRNLGRELEEPLDDKTQLVPLRDGEEVGNTLRPEDMQRVFDEFPRKTFLQWNVYLAVMLSAHTGLRAAELTGLEPRHLLNNNQEIRVEQELLQSWDADTKASYWEIDPSLKGRQSRTVVVWDSQLISQLLAEHMKRKSQQRMRLGV
jgi:integrase